MTTSGSFSCFMAAAPRRKRKTTVVVPADAVAPLPAAESRPLYRNETFADGSVRPVRVESRHDAERAQALADFYGAAPGLPVRANLRDMNSILAELVTKLDIREADFAPELLNAAWEKAVGSFLATQAQLISVDKKTAVVRTAHPAVRFELQRLRPQIIRALNASLGEACVRTVRITHGGI